MNRKIRFVINPIAGVKNKEDLPQLIEQELSGSNLDFEVVFTEHRLHALELAKEASEQGFTEVIAAGGDGTINETASGLIGSETTLGIIPMGSGNGLARHLGIPLEAKKAIQTLTKAQTLTIDTGEVNGRPFLCTAGVGFEAHVSFIFDQMDGRGLKTYLNSVVKELGGYKPKEYTLSFDGETRKEEFFTLCFANASQWGNNVYICPDADMTDGQLNLCSITPFPGIAYPGIIRRLFQKSIQNSKHYQQKTIRGIRVEIGEDETAHVDGDPVDLGRVLNVQVVPKSLKVLVPK